MKVQNYPATLLMFCIIASCQSSANAQQRKLQNNPEAPIATYNEPKTIANKVELPDLPEFTGQVKLEKARQFSANDQVERTYAYVYQAKDDATRITDWYRTALSMYKWDMDSSTNKAIMATNPRTGNSCSIYCDNETTAGCKLHISYTFMQKPSDKTALNY